MANGAAERGAVASANLPNEVVPRPAAAKDTDAAARGTDAVANGALPAARAAAPASELRYPLQDGYVANWLIAGPAVVRVNDVAPFLGADDEATKANVLRHFRPQANEVAASPCEAATLTADGHLFPWSYYRTEDDHKVSSSIGGGCVYLKSWAYAEIDSPAAVNGTFELGVHGPADVWLNGQPVFHADEQSIFVPKRHAFSAALNAGRNALLVRFEVCKIRVGAYGMSLRLPEGARPATVVLPTSLPETAARLAAECATRAAQLDRARFRDDEPVVIHFAGQSFPPVALNATLRGDGKLIRAIDFTARPRASVELVRASQLKGRKFSIDLVPTAIADEQVRKLVSASLTFSTTRGDYPQVSRNTTFEDRARHVVERAAASRGLLAEVAKMELGRWKDVQVDAFPPIIEKLNARRDTSDFDMAVLAGMMVRYGGQGEFPASVRDRVKPCILGFKYWCDEPGKDVMWFYSENHQITFHAAEIMAGQAFPDEIFTNARQTGRWHREKGERLALDWLRRRADGGFHEWDSNVYFSVDLLALAHLADLAENDEVRQLASVVLTKMMLTIALNSRDGTFGSCHARTYPGNVLSGRSDGTNGATWLFWGVGSGGGGDLKSTLPLALMKRYRLPTVVERIATDEPLEFWNRERHGGTLDPAVDRYGGPWEVNKVTYRTPEYMLASAQDFHPGSRGNMQHIWQATLTADALTFVNQPPFVAEKGSPNYWVGNLTLPRVAQWKDLLIDLRNQRNEPGMGFTHAYFPMYAFDEMRNENGWTLARAGDGYIALRSKAGIRVQKTGRYAFRELRSYANSDVWLCQMGSQRQDGGFDAFCRAVAALPVAFGDAAEGPNVKLTSLRGQAIEFAWRGPFLIDGREQPLSGFPHYENPYFTAPWPMKELKLDFAGEHCDLKW